MVAHLRQLQKCKDRKVPKPQSAAATLSRTYIATRLAPLASRRTPAPANAKPNTGTPAGSGRQRVPAPKSSESMPKIALIHNASQKCASVGVDYNGLTKSAQS